MQLTTKMQERIAAGDSFLYTTRDGHEWYIDYDEQDGYGAYDGAVICVGFDSLFTCHEALESDSVYWRGVGWYRPRTIAWKDECIWCETPDDVKELERSMERRFGDEPTGVEYMGKDER